MDALVTVEKAALAHLKADAAFTAVIPSANVHTSDGVALPAVPFIKPGAAISSPLYGRKRWRDIRLPFYIRANARTVNKVRVETARDHMGRCVHALCESLVQARLSVPDGEARFILINDIRRIVDGEADCLEATIEFRVRLLVGGC